MEKHLPDDALDRALTDLYHTDIPEGYRAAWRAAVIREEQSAVKAPPLPPRRKLWRVALPVAAALALVVGALSVGSLIPTVVTDSLYDSRTPVTGMVGNAAGPSLPGNGGNTPGGNNSAAESATSRSAVAPAPSAAWNPAEAFTAQSDTAATDTADTGSEAAAESASKIVRTADLTIATSAFDTDSAAIADLTSRLGGYVASVSQYGEASDQQDRVAYYTLRIPSDQLDPFLSGISSVGRITARSETTTDETVSYADTSLRLQTQQAKMTRLQALLSQASDVSDLLEIENEIANTQYQLDSLESALRTIDRDVDRSTVSLTLQEQGPGDTAQATELTLGQRIASGFEASARWLATFGQNLLVFLAMLLPVLLPLAVVTALIGLAVRRHRARSAADAVTEPRTPTDPASPAGNAPADSNATGPAGRDPGDAP